MLGLLHFTDGVTLEKSSNISRTRVLFASRLVSHLGSILPLGAIWQCLETYLQLSLLGGEGATGIWWEDARDAAQYPAAQDSPPQHGVIRPRGSTALGLRNSGAQMYKRHETYYVWLEGKLVQPLRKTVWRVLRKRTLELPSDPAMPLLGIYPDKTSKRYMYPYVHCNAIQNSLAMETT